MAKKSAIAELNCGVAQSLSVIGDRWALMILHCAFNGVRTYREFREHLDLSSSVLSEQLARMTEAGVFERRPSRSDGRSIEYRLTEKGFDLYPIIVALMRWGEKWSPHPDGPRLRLIERQTGEEIRGVEVRSAGGEKLDAREVWVETGPGADDATRRLIERKRR